MKTIQLTAINQLSNEFNKVFNKWCTAEQLAEINKRNATYDEDSCASHDFYDANMAMAKAFKNTFKREINLQSNTDVSLWNAAWALSKTNQFVVI